MAGRFEVKAQRPVLTEPLCSPMAGFWGPAGIAGAGAGEADSGKLGVRGSLFRPQLPSRKKWEMLPVESFIRVSLRGKFLRWG